MRFLIIGVAFLTLSLGAVWSANAVARSNDFVNPLVEKEMSVNEYIHFLAKLNGVSERKARAIIGCESQFNPNNVHLNYRKEEVNGKFTSVVWSRDWGYFQLNDFYQEAPMAKLGWNIFDKWQNLQAGFYILRTQGTAPWTWSEWCWSKK